MSKRKPAVSIISSEAVSNALLTDGRREITEEHLSSTGALIRRHFVLPSGADLNATLTARAASLESGRKLAEQNYYLNRAPQIDLTTIQPDLNTRREVWGHCLRVMKMLRGPDATHFVDLVLYVDLNIVVPEILAFTGFTLAEWNHLLTRTNNNLVPLKADIASDDLDVVER